MRRRVYFKVGVQIDADDDKSYKAAVKAVRDDLYLEERSAGTHNFAICLKTIKEVNQEAS
jgi:L-rhamnose mutarotase